MQDYLKALFVGLLVLSVTAICLYSMVFAEDAFWADSSDGQSEAEDYDHFGEELPPDEEEVQILDSGKVLDSGFPPDYPTSLEQDVSAIRRDLDLILYQLTPLGIICFLFVWFCKWFKRTFVDSIL